MAIHVIDEHRPALSTRRSRAIRARREAYAEVQAGAGPLRPRSAWLEIPPFQPAIRTLPRVVEVVVLENPVLPPFSCP